MHIVFRRADGDAATGNPTTASSSGAGTTTPSTVTQSFGPSAVPQGWIIFAVIGGVVLLVTAAVSVFIAKAKRRQRLERKATRFHQLHTSRSTRRTYSWLSKRSMADRALDAEEQRSLMITKSLASRSGSIGSISESISTTGSTRGANRSDALKELEAGMYRPSQEQHPIAKHPFWSPGIPDAELPASMPSRSRSSTVSSTAPHLAPPTATFLSRPPQYYAVNQDSYPEALATPSRVHIPQQHQR